MEALIQPDIGLSFWTIVCFLLLLFILKKSAWQPLMNAINEREEGLRRTMESADHAKKEAERIKDELNARLADLKTEIKEQLDEARKAAAKEKEAMLSDARKRTALMMESTKKEIEAEKNAAMRDIRRKISEISMLTAEKILSNSVDADANAGIAEKYLAEVEKERPEISRDLRQN